MTPAREIEKLRRILDVARSMAVTDDLGALLRIIVEASCEVLDCDRATIFLFDAQTDELYSRVATGAEEIRFPAGAGIAGEAAQKRVCVNVPDAYADARFNREVDRTTGYVTRNLLTLPLENLAGDLIGVLQALNKRGGPFDAGDEDLARALAAQAGVALDRGRLLEEFAAKQRMAHDLEIARNIQQALFPRENPEVGGYEIAGWNRSADETGGDCYDFLVLPDGRLAIFLADATGHGIGSALVIAQARSLLRAMLSVTQDLPQIAAGVNNLLVEDLSEDRFVTAFIGILDPRTHEIEYISGGQGPLLMITPEGVDNRTANSLPFAIMPDMDYQTTDRFAFKPGSMLALLTDGFYETSDANRQHFGEGRVSALLQARLKAPLPDAIAALHAAILDFADGQAQEDDLTAVLIRRAR